jgi:hypothetical protein
MTDWTSAVGALRPGSNRGGLLGLRPGYGDGKATGGMTDSSQAGDVQDAVRWWEAYQLAGADDVGELRVRSEAGDEHARWQLAGWLADRRRPAEAAELITPLADAGDNVASMWLARWLADSDVAELRRRAFAGEYHALQELAELLAQGGHIDKLRQILVTPEGRIRPELAAWLARQHADEVMELGARAGDEDCLYRLDRRRRFREAGYSGPSAERSQGD